MKSLTKELVPYVAIGAPVAVTTEVAGWAEPTLTTEMSALRYGFMTGLLMSLVADLNRSEQRPAQTSRNRVRSFGRNIAGAASGGIVAGAEATMTYGSLGMGARAALLGLLSGYVGSDVTARAAESWRDGAHTAPANPEATTPAPDAQGPGPQ